MNRVKMRNVADVLGNEALFLSFVCLCIFQDKVHSQRECDFLPEQHCVIPAAIRSHL